MYSLLIVGFAGFVGFALAHGDHDQEPMLPEGTDWATRHMLEEHHIAGFDAASFFNLHDFDDSGKWTVQDLLRTYGLKDASTNHIPQSEKEAAMNEVIKLFDADKDGSISFAEYVLKEAAGIHLPDFGWGPGHHGDDEYEYEIHHFEKFHGPDATMEELTHPEDIEHFRMHDMLEEQQQRQEEMDRMSIVEANIPLKFRKMD